MRKELTCILCPQGCRIEVDVVEGELSEVRGNKCVRGEGYAKEEILHPTRVLTSTVRVKGWIYPVLPVKSERPIPKEKIFEAMEEVRKVVVTAPFEMGQVVVEDLVGSGVRMVVGRGGLY